MVVSAAAIDRSQIEFFKSTNKQKPTARPDAEAPSKRQKYILPALPKKEKKPEGSPSRGGSNADDTSFDDSPAESRATPTFAAGDDSHSSRRFSGQPRSFPEGNGDRKEGFFKSVHDALEKIYREVRIRIPRSLHRDLRSDLPRGAPRGRDRSSARTWRTASWTRSARCPRPTPCGRSIRHPSACAARARTSGAVARGPCGSDHWRPARHSAPPQAWVASKCLGPGVYGRSAPEAAPCPP